MPFRVKLFKDNVGSWVGDDVKAELEQVCECYNAATTSLQKARCVKSIIEVLDREVDEHTRRVIMEACGHRCISTSTLKNAVKFQEQASNLDELLVLLNEQHIGGGHLQRYGNVIHVAYDSCYCGSVSKTKEPFTETYCHCSCGWYQKLFETVLDRPVRVELLGSIIQGDQCCEFRIHLSDG